MFFSAICPKTKNLAKIIPVMQKDCTRTSYLCRRKGSSERITLKFMIAMKELRCPKCGNVFQVDEADYASILSQVKNAEFEAEIERRLREMEARQLAEQALKSTQARQEFESRMNKKDLELSAKEAEISQLKASMQAMLAKLNGEKDQEIIRLKNQLENIARQKDAERQLALAEKDKAIDALHAALGQEESKLRIAVMEEQKKSELAIQQREQTITQLKSDMALERYKAQAETEELNKRHLLELQTKQEQIDYYKDLKTRMSTKMVGETLEIHCSTLFNQLLRPIMPGAYFEKDNEVADGTKGDFIFRDSVDGVEYLSIMFEMKNEMDTTSTKHKNEDFFKKLDEDRRKKGCEYAVLVSLLEPDSELYNGGIVDVSHRYEKMYVIRPQFFIPLITLLVQTSKKSLEYRKQLIQAQSKEVDVTNFENKLEEFRKNFGRHYELASRKFGDAIKQIDDTIAKLQKVKENLLSSENNFRLANKDTEELTIRKLTYKNPTMRQKFDEARRQNGGAGEQE